MRNASQWIFGALLLFALRAGAEGGLEPPVLRLSLEDGPSTLDWNASRNQADRFVISFLMRGLIKVNEGAKPICDLCRSYRVSEDGRTITFELDDVLWSDGVKVEARHFVDSFERLLNPAHHYDLPEDFKLIEGGTQGPAKWDSRKLGVKALGPNQLEFRLKKRSSTLLWRLSTVQSFPMRKDLSGSATDAGEQHAQKAVLGPYILAEWSRGKRIVLEGNPKYRGSRPVYRVEFIMGPHASLLGKFKSGRLEILSRPTNEDILKFPGKKLQVSPYWATRLLLFNITRAPLGERNLRRAILHALDRDVVPAQLGSGERKVTGILPPGIKGHRALSLVSHDLPLAQQEFEAAMAGAVPAQMRLLGLDTGEDRKLALWLSSRLAKLKLNLVSEFVSTSEYARRMSEGSFDLALHIFSFETPDPVEILRSFRTGASRNWGHWTQVAFDSVVDQLLDAKEEDVGKLVEKACQLIEAQEVALIPLGYPGQPFLMSSRVSSFATTPFGDPDLVRIELRR